MNSLNLSLVLTDLLLSGGIVLCYGFVEGPLVVGVVVHPLTEMVPKVKTPTHKTKCNSVYY